MTKREPVTVTVPPWRSAIARTMARPRPEPPGGSAPEALEGVLGLLGARAVVADAEARAVAVVLDFDRDAALAVAARVGDEVADGALERGALAEHDRGFRRYVVGAGLAGDVGEVDRLAARRRGGVLARQRQQVVEQHAEPRRVGLDVGQHLRVGAVLGRVGEVAS